jgi:hypothetical protein
LSPEHAEDQALTMLDVDIHPHLFGGQCLMVIAPWSTLSLPALPLRVQIYAKLFNEFHASLITFPFFVC